MKGRLIPAAVALFAFALAGPARADVHVDLSPAVTPVAVRSTDTYVVEVSSDTPTTLSDVVLLLPGHGQPCGQPDEPGYPYGADPDTNFVVLSPEPVVTGRWVTWYAPPGGWRVGGGTSLEFDLDVLTPDIAACFYAGASAHTTDGTPVDGIAQGAELDVVQHPDFGTGGAFEPLNGRRVQLDWWISAGPDAPASVVQERLGLPAGFSLVSSSLGAGKRRSVPSFSEQWRTPLHVDAGQTITESVVLDTPCTNIGATIHARLRVWRSDGVIAGTGDGPALDLPAC